MAKTSKTSAALAAQSPLSAVRIEAQASIVRALSTATPSHVIAAKRAGKAVSYEIEAFTPFEDALFALCESIEARAYAIDSTREVIASMVREHYGKTAPTFEQYTHLQGAMHLMSLDAGYTGQMMRKHIAHAVKSAYGALPVSMSAAAIAKRAQRPAKTAKPAKPAPIKPAEAFQAGVAYAQGSESIEQFIARVGVVATLSALNRILECEESTKSAARAVLDVVPMVQGAAA